MGDEAMGAKKYLEVWSQHPCCYDEVTEHETGHAEREEDWLASVFKISADC